MSNDINLLVKNDKKLLKTKSKLKVFRLISVVFLVLLLLISVVILILNQQLSSSTLEKEREAILSEMLPFREREAKLKVVNNRVENILKVLSKRVDISKIVNTILDKVPDGMTVDGLEFNENKISLKVSSGSLLVVDGFFNNLIDMAKRKEFIKALALDSLDMSELAGIYNVSLIINI